MTEPSGSAVAAPKRRPSWARRALRTALGLLLLAISAVAILLWRGIALPEPTGPFAVGRTSRHLIDESRPEVFTEAPEDRRELMVAIHYPAAAGDGAAPSSYLDASVAAGFAQALEMPQFVFQVVHPHALREPAAAQADGGSPVVLFSHGFGQPPVFYTATLEDLASHGFIVVSINHTYSSGISVFSDGRVMLQNEAASHPEVSIDLPGDEQADSSNQETDATKETAQTQDAGNDVGSVWVGDVRFVLDQLEKLNRDDRLLAGRMNLAQVGVFGHSFGGAAAIRTVQIDPRFLAGINLDGTDLRVTAGATIERPVMWINSPHEAPSDALLKAIGKSREWFQEQMQKHAQRTDEVLTQAPQGRRLRIRGAAHQTFTSDFTLASASWPWNWLTRGLDVGTIPADRAVLVLNSLVIEFFQEHLRGQTRAPAASLVHRFPEVEQVSPEAGQGTKQDPRADPPGEPSAGSPADEDKD